MKQANGKSREKSKKKLFPFARIKIIKDPLRPGYHRNFDLFKFHRNAMNRKRTTDKIYVLAIGVEY